MRNRNNDFILRDKKMADFERRQFETGLEFVRWSIVERNNSSEDSFEPKKDAQVIRVRGAAAPRVFFNSNYLFHVWESIGEYNAKHHLP